MFWGKRVTITVSNQISAHSHSMYEVVVCHSSTGKHEIDGKMYDFKPGRTFFLPKMVSHKAIGTSDKPAEIAFVCFDLHTDIEHFSPAIRTIISDLTKNRHYASEEPNESGEKNMEISVELQREINNHSHLSQNIAGAIISQLILNHAKSISFNPVSRKDDDSAKFADLCAWISSGANAGLSLDDAAKRVGMSRSLFTRQFRKRTGMSLVEYVISIKTGRAIKLVSSTSKSIYEIAAECGFNNIGYFYRMFHRHTNSTPLKLRTYVTKTGRMPLN